VKVLLENKVAIVTGATGGLGRVVVKKLLESGAQVVASYRDEGKLAELLRFVGDFRDKVTAVKSDVTDEDSVKSFVQKTVEKHGRVDILFNIVGAYAGGTDVVNTEEDTWNMMMNVNLKSAFLCSKAVLPLMIRQNYGRMVNVSSWMAFEKNRRVKSAAYAVSKAGLVVLTETLALEVKNYDINVNCVAPSTIDTPANRRNMPKADPSKWVDPKDIAEVMIFLVSDKSKVVSGASVPVYGKV
jgi:NAD(P)-dependent dehydrogenase (short-subunit alcohol dehydrogenase family)